MTISGSHTGAASLVPPMKRTFHDAHIITCDCANDRFGPELVAALKGLGFHTVLNVQSLEELERYCGMGAEIVFLNPHCHDEAEGAIVAKLAAARRRHVQLVMVSDERHGEGGFTRISRGRALQPDTLRKLMAELQPEWEQHQPKRMGGPNDEDLERKHIRW